MDCIYQQIPTIVGSLHISSSSLDSSYLEAPLPTLTSVNIVQFFSSLFFAATPISIRIPFMSVSSVSSPLATSIGLSWSSPTRTTPIDECRLHHTWTEKKKTEKNRGKPEKNRVKTEPNRAKPKKTKPNRKKPSQLVKKQAKSKSRAKPKKQIQTRKNQAKPKS